MSFCIEFPHTSHKPVCLPEGANLSEELSVVNSPVLFGCRTGICGTCLVQIQSGHQALKPAEESEQEALEVYAPGIDNARLACQIALTANIALIKIEGG
ncbi:MAG: (2Fe-2S)-binding protein [Candidatus Melainabacteria bacterium]|nr:MAG: (2Fe-2S)-binding protein [Candidatus Melainabacteria bacterium]